MIGRLMKHGHAVVAVRATSAREPWPARARHASRQCAKSVWLLMNVFSCEMSMLPKPVEPSQPAAAAKPL